MRTETRLVFDRMFSGGDVMFVVNVLYCTLVWSEIAELQPDELIRTLRVSAL